MKAPVARKMITKMRYQAATYFNPGTTLAVRVFSANSLFDPDRSGVGHQPRGFDQLVGVLYDHYVVIGAKIIIQFAPEVDGNTKSTQLCGVAIKDNATTTDKTGYMESGYCKYSLMSPEAGYRTTVSYKLNPNKFLGRSKPLSDPDLKGDASSNPTEEVFFHVFTGPLDSASAANDVFANVVIEYTVALIEPKLPAIS
jgi:hypothetical protein